jgi:hypothetical protein
MKQKLIVFLVLMSIFLLSADIVRADFQEISPEDSGGKDFAALPVEVAGLGTDEDWWLAAQDYIQQDSMMGSGNFNPQGLSITSDWQHTGDQLSDEFGYSVASAGDINGDGYADVIVGAPELVGVGKKGKAYLFLGSATGLETSPDWSQIGEADNDSFGCSVAGAGDVNGDGYADVIVGAYTHASEGRAYVFLGSATGLSLSPLTPFDGDPGSNSFGYSVAGAGDVNADGYADIIISDRGFSSETGKVYIYHGGAAGPDTSADRTLSGEGTQDWFGHSVAGAGDVNGDGYADVIVGAVGYDKVGATQSGAAYVYYGGSSGVSSTWDWKMEGSSKDDRFGYSVAGAGDVNGDGYADVIIGAKYFGNDNPGDWHQGAAYVYHGSASGLNEIIWDWLEVGENDADRFGESVVGAGDVNGDGYADVIIGAGEVGANEGRAYVYRGGSGGLAADPNWTNDGESNNSYFGFSVAGAGDVNGDGYADIVVGAIGFSSDTGKAYAYYGMGDIPSDADQWGEEGISTGDQFGFSLASAGDVNGDGYADVIIGAQGFNSSQGRVYVYLGAASGLPAFPLWHADGENGNDWFGGSVAAAGDVNGDGYADIIVGARGYDDGANGEAGKAYLYYGGATDLNDDPWEAVGEAGNSEFGSKVAGAGDVNGDGYADILVSAPRYDNYRGKVYVYYGSAEGLSATVDRELTGAARNEHFGYSVAGAGDLNGDGYADVVVGGYGYPGSDSGGDNKGIARAYYGSASGLNSTSVWSAEGENDGDQFGRSVAGAGDVNGDGHSDILVGAYLFGGERGKVYLYDFTSSGMGTPWVATGIAAPDHFGYSVAGAGDVNGDGFADILVGAINLISGPMKGYTSLFLGPRAGISYNADWKVDGEADGDRFGISVAGAGDVNGDGFADVLAGASMGGSGGGKAYAYFGNNGGGQLVLSRQMRKDSSQIQPWGLSDTTDGFLIQMWGTNPAGRSRLKLEAEACPPGVAFGDPACTTALGTSWQDSVPVGGNPPPKVLSVRFGQLDGETLYRWRVRTLYAPYAVLRTGITAPPNPAHGPWRRFLGQGMEADLRTGMCTYGLSVTPVSREEIGRPGETVTFNLRVTNDGDCTDGINVAVSGNAWVTNAPSTLGPLAAGADQKLVVTAEVPTSATPGDSDSATITFTSQGDPGQSVSSNLTTAVVAGWRLYLPIIVMP